MKHVLLQRLWLSLLIGAMLLATPMDPPKKEDIVFGKTPSGSTQPVLVFIHGYTGSTGSWLDDNDISSRAYSAGFRTAFVEVDPDGSTRQNGIVFADQLKRITSHFKVSKVIVVAHSKGGIDTESSIIHNSAGNYVKAVISLGSPYWGTPLADLAQSNWVWWLSYVFGQYNDATYSLQTGVMSAQRNAFDRHSKNTVPFYSVGAWGRSGILYFSGWYLDASGYGKSNLGNDGVVPYRSALRPASEEISDRYPNSSSDIDHWKMKKGYHAWRYIASAVEKIEDGGRRKQDEVAYTNPNAVVTSSHYIVTSESEQKSFKVDANTTTVHFDYRTKNASAKLHLKTTDGKQISAEPVSRTKTSDGLGAERSVYSFKLPKGEYRIASNESYAGIITFENGANVQLSSDLSSEKLVYKEGEKINLSIAIPNSNQATITAVLRHVGDFEKEGSSEKDIQLLTFNRTENGFYTATASANYKGIYNLTEDIHTTEINRSLVTSFPVVATANGHLEKQSLPTQYRLHENYPNPFNPTTTLSFTLPSSAHATITIYDMLGREVKTLVNQEYLAGTHSVQWNGTNNLNNAVASGIYFYRLSTPHFTQTKSMVLLK